MGISQDNWHKRRKTGGKRNPIHKKRKYELGRQAAATKVILKFFEDINICRLELREFIWFVVVVEILSTEHFVLIPEILLGLLKVNKATFLILYFKNLLFD